MTGLQLALLGGAIVGAGIAALLWRLVPADPDLADVVYRLSPQAAKARSSVPVAAQTRMDRLGLWSMRHLPARWWAGTPTKELALLGIPVHRFYAKKVAHAVIGFVAVPTLSVWLGLLGWSLPLLIPTVGSFGLAAVMFFAVDADVRTEAKQARVEFTRALSAYCDLVAVDRLSGSGTRQAMERAATTGDSWVFQRISEELARSRWSGVPPWDSLHELSEELGLPDLADVADILRLTQDGAQVYSNLRARSAAMRTAMLNDELAKANAVGQRMWVPMVLLVVVFMAMVLIPSLLRLLGGQ